MRDISEKQRLTLTIAALAAIVLLGLLLAFGGGSKKDAANGKVLNIYMWSDYIGDSTVADFERETGIKVHFDTYDSNETLFAKLVAGHTGYDIIVPSSNWAKLEIKSGLLHPLNRTLLPNQKNVDPALLQRLTAVDPGNQYLTPWLWGLTTVGINVDKVKAAIAPMPLPDDAWDLVFKPEYASRLKGCGLSMMESADEMLPAALHYLGRPAFSHDPADYQAAAALLRPVRPYVTLFSSSGYINDLAGGSLCVAVGYNGDIGIAGQRARESGNGQHIEALLPKSGAIMFFDTMAIPADAEHLEAAHKWIDYIYRPEVQAGIVNKVFYANTVRAADPLIRPEILGNKAVFLPDADVARMTPPDMVDNATRRIRTRLYTSFKAGL